LLFVDTISLAKPLSSLITVTAKPQAPNFELLDMDDNLYKLSDFKGKPVIINFWASWCHECRTELPAMNRAWAKIKNEGIQILAVNVGESEETILSFANKFPISFLVLRDGTAVEAKKWSIIGMPTTFVIDPKGRIVYQAVGPRAWDSELLLDKVRALRARIQ
jgi:peroxiredoxin